MFKHKSILEKTPLHLEWALPDEPAWARVHIVHNPLPMSTKWVNLFIFLKNVLWKVWDPFEAPKVLTVHHFHLGSALFPRISNLWNPVNIVAYPALKLTTTKDMMTGLDWELWKIAKNLVCFGQKVSSTVLYNWNLHGLRGIIPYNTV
jgi:hypothetical protein